jgi:hypothetical protein
MILVFENTTFFNVQQQLLDVFASGYNNLAASSVGAARQASVR